MVDVRNPSTGDDFVLMLKELQCLTAAAGPTACGLPVPTRALDGLCKVLSLDMRVVDPAWIAETA